MTEQLNIILVPHTHWDREWYLTFQQFRARLVHTIDKLLDILDRDNNFTYFMLDGQTIVLDDYLEVQPEQEERLKKYTRAGRINVGPWFIQPDEFLVSGESLIRNLQVGLQRATEFGGGMRIGYVPDCFGHIAQLPQILQGFGIDNAIFWRGVGAEAHRSEFYWAAPDGTQVLVAHLADPLGYSNARLMPLEAEEFATRVKLLTAQILPRATTNTLLFMNGSDHLEPQDGLPATIEAANPLLAHINPEHEKFLAVLGHNHALKHFDGVAVHIGTLPEYIETVRRQNAIATINGAIAQAMSTIVAAIDTHAPVPTPHTNHPPVPIVVFNPGPGPRTEAVQAVVQFPGSLRNAVIIDEWGQHMPYTVINRWRQVVGSMSVAREMVAAAVALAGINAPGMLIRMAEA